MPVTAITRWKGSMDRLRPHTKRAAERLLRSGATSVEVGLIFTGPHTGEVLATVKFADWAAYARSQQAQAEDSELQDAIKATAAAGGELQSRTLVVSVDL